MRRPEQGPVIANDGGRIPGPLPGGFVRKGGQNTNVVNTERRPAPPAPFRPAAATPPSPACNTKHK